RRRHTRFSRDWSSDVCSSDLYLGLATGDGPKLLALLVLVAGNGLLAGVGLLVMIRPFLGEALPTPRPPHEAPIAMLAGPVLLGRSEERRVGEEGRAGGRACA